MIFGNNSSGLLRKLENINLGRGFGSCFKEETTRESRAPEADELLAQQIADLDPARITPRKVKGNRTKFFIEPPSEEPITIEMRGDIDDENSKVNVSSSNGGQLSRWRSRDLPKTRHALNSLHHAVHEQDGKPAQKAA